MWLLVKLRGSLTVEERSVSLYSIRLYLEPNPGGVYTVNSPDVPGLVTEGSTPAVTLHNVQEALDALKEAWQELEVDVPSALRPALADCPQTVEILVAA
jgi:predicted RNase H-like HicB family nuclease